MNYFLFGNSWGAICPESGHFHFENNLCSGGASGLLFFGAGKELFAEVFRVELAAVAAVGEPGDAVAERLVEELAVGGVEEDVVPGMDHADGLVLAEGLRDGAEAGLGGKLVELILGLAVLREQEPGDVLMEADAF